MSPKPTRRSPAVIQVAEHVQALLAPERTLRVGVDGADGVGKTTFASHLADELRALSIAVLQSSMDDFHHPRAHRYQRGKRDPIGYMEDSFDQHAFVRLVLLFT